MRSRIFILIFFIFSSASGIAQEQFVDPPARLLTTFHFRQLTGGVVLFNAHFADFPDTLNFILDTGSGGISLDSATADHFGIEPQPTSQTILGIAGVRKVSFIYDKKLTLPGLEVDSLNFHINDYSILSAVYGEKIDGIMGYSVLSRYIFQIDYDDLMISIYSKGRIKYPKGGWLFEPLMRTIPIQDIRVKDAETRNTKFLFDIGAGLCLLFNKDFITDSSLLHKKRVLFPKEAEGVGGKVDMHLTVIKEVRFGPYRFRSVPVFIFDDTYNITSYPFLAGLIGNDILRRFNLIMNYAKGEFYLMRNKHYDDLFDYSYSGVELYMIDDQIVLGDVARDSPAEQAGLHEGDVVIAINRLFNQDFYQYKQALQNPGAKVKIIVNRDGELLEFEFKVKSIL